MAIMAMSSDQIAIMAMSSSLLFSASIIRLGSRSRFVIFSALILHRWLLMSVLSLRRRKILLFFRCVMPPSIFISNYKSK